MHNHDLNRLNNNPFKMLEEELGFPFFTSLQAVVKLRIQSLDDNRASKYLGTLIEGLQNKHSWIADDWVILFFQRMLGGDRFDRLWDMEELPGDNADGKMGVLVMDDLLTALGVLERQHHPTIEMSIGRDDLLALDKVFSPSKLSLAEIAEQLQRAEEDRI